MRASHYIIPDTILSIGDFAHLTNDDATESYKRV